MCVLGRAGDVQGTSLRRLIVQMDDLCEGVYLFCGQATSGDLLFPGVAEFFTLLHILGTIFHPHTPGPQTDLFTDSHPVNILYTPLLTHACILLKAHCIYTTHSSARLSTLDHKHTFTEIKCMNTNFFCFVFFLEFRCSATFCVDFYQ